MERRKIFLLLFICAATLGTCRSQNDSCVVAGFSECCETGPCELDSGCFCDDACYVAGDCCSDIDTICSQNPDLPSSDLCIRNPCQNAGVCVVTSDSEYTCQCMYGYAGINCEVDIDFCLSEPCLFGGTCTDGVFMFACDCRPGFSGRQCEVNIDECASNPCQFGSTCNDGDGQYTCVCSSGYTGVNCDMNIDDCSPDPCVNGTCVDGINEYICNCAPLFSGADCSLMTLCSLEEDTCQNNGLCKVAFIGNSRETFCECLSGYTGDNCEVDINECAGNPCVNGGTCRDLVGEYVCDCPMDFTGQNCSIEIDPCDPAAVPCQNGAICREGECFCRNGFTGILCENNIDDCFQVTQCQNSGTCIDGIASFTCQCTEAFTGDSCEIPTSHPCGAFPCNNGGTCEITSSTDYTCTCLPEFTDTNCSVDNTPCLSSPCTSSNTAICMDSEDSFECVCLPGYTGLTCGEEINECQSEPCANGGQCQDVLNGFTCSCADGFEGDTCSDDIDECLSSPCQSNGTCINEIAGYTCICPNGYTGEQCEGNINDCSSSPCQNGATCEDLVAEYLCLCPLGYTDRNCSTNIPDCLGEPCGNGGTCMDLVGTYQCMCASGYTGENCMANIDDCVTDSCFGGATCEDGLEMFTCLCPLGFTGDACDVEIDNCDSNPCQNEGNCTSQPNGTLCTCLESYTGSFCENRLCTLDCQNGAICIENGTSFTCECTPDFIGTLCETPFDICDTLPCAVNSTCLPMPNAEFMCLCSAGFTGEQCNTDIDECASTPCANEGICIDKVNGFECMCRNGFTGDTCQTDIDDCSPNPCRFNSTCNDLVANYSCDCVPGYSGRNCTIDVDLCDPLPCMNSGSCMQNLTDNSFECSCLPGFQGQFCEFDVNECNTTMQYCSNGGTCQNTYGGVNCICPSGFGGLVCEVNLIDDCINLCMNNATCVDVGQDFVCLCPPGYTGVICDSETLECDSDPCQNGGRCREEFLNFTCLCAADYTGRMCEIDLNPCSSAPCLNDADCVNGEAGSEQFSCVCAPGYTGELCDVDIDDCESDPCLMSSTCTDAVNNFTCECASGFGGHLCDINLVDDCDLSLCLNGGTCVDIGADFRCDCEPGFTGPICEFGTNECLDNPCFNNATCRDLFGSYECFCLPGFSGTACETDINECAGVDCNNGTCRDLVDAFTCDCTPGYIGDRCETEIDECEEVVCSNGGTCIDQVNNYTCACARGFQGRRCEENINDCELVDCGNGTCMDLVDDYYCQCVMGYTGSQCEVMIDECEQQPCLNNATCVDALNNFTCYCLDGFEGRYCEINIDDCNNTTCLNGATCIDGINSYTCECVFGYAGENCEEVIDFCTAETCENGGTCMAIVGSIACVCSPLYTGVMCEMRIDLCQDTEQCSNSGQCIPTVQDGFPAFECDCVGPYRGDLCEIFDPCVESPCYNNGTCTEDSNSTLGYRCSCPSPYLGHNCLYSDLCLLNQPCTSGGSCLNNIPSLGEIQASEGGSLPMQSTTCICRPEFTGVACEIEITPCYYLPCENGGTCQVDPTSDLGYSCQCSLIWNGANCTDEINIVTPSFSGGSYLSHAIPTSAGAGLNYSLALLTAHTSGLLLYATQSDSQTTQNYIALGLESGQLVLYIGTASGPTQLRTELIVSDNEWHTVELQVGSQDVSLQVDNEVVSLSGDAPVELGPLVYIGGISNFSTLPSEVQQTTGLVGCVHDRMANGQSVELAVVYHEGRDVLQCLEPVCPYIQCQNEAVCRELTEPPGFVCECLPFFSGVYCETPLPVCDPNPCQFGGLCREEQSTFSCRCPLETAGRTCGDDISISVPSFSGESYITYPSLPAALRTLTVTITFTPVTSSGMLFFTSSSAMEFSDYFSLALVDGRLEMRYNLGSGNFVVKSENEIELSAWHSVTATLNSGIGELTVDDEPLITGTSRSVFTVLNTQSDVWLGGYDNFINLSSLTGTPDGFIGCISSLDIDGNALHLILGAVEGYDVTQCNTSSCANDPCMNGASCLEEGPSFVCVCPPGIMGSLCSNMADRCSTEVGLCAEGATCVNSEDGVAFSCLCPVGRDGERCDEDIQIVTPAFNTTSYLQYNPYAFASSTSSRSITISFNPASAHGLLFYHGDYTENSDFVSLSMIEQRIEFRYNLGSGLAILISDPVSLDEWHYVTASRDGRDGAMTVDDGDKITGQSFGSFSIFNAAGDLFVGGVSDYSTVSPQVGTEVGFTGCISDIEINGVAVDVLAAAVGGRGIAECPIDPCADLTCSNGGTCKATGGSTPTCLCPLGFAGPTCDLTIDIDVPYFTGQSHIAYDSLTNTFATTSLTLEIRPSSLDGLVLFNQQTNGGDFIAVLLRDGTVEFWYDLGSGAATISSTDPVELDVWHRIEVYRSGASGQLIVDEALPVPGSSQGSYTGLQLGAPLYIGGVSDSASGNLPPQIRGIAGYQGCVRSVSVNSADLDLISGANSGVSVQECPLLPCTSNLCLNNGVCFVESGDGSSDQQCLCSLPFTGETCSERVEGFSEASFSGQSYLEYSADAVSIDLQRISTSVEISFTPSSLTGLLFYMGPASPNAPNDYLYIALYDGTVELTFDLGRGAVSVNSSQPLLAGQSYTIIVQRNGGSGILSVGNGGSATVQAPSGSSNFDHSATNFAAYLGGAPSVAVLTEGSYSSGISGCVTAVRIGQVGSPADLPLSTATTGAAVEQCTQA